MNPLIARFNYFWKGFHRPVIALLVLVGILLLIALVAGNDTAMPQEEETVSLAEQIRTGVAPIPPLTEATQAKLDKSIGFSALVSYTANGFEPSLVSIKRGEAVRFTNNSSNDLWISASGEKVAVYPRTGETCGSSDLDSCEPFDPQDFWEFTFDTEGTWEVVNNLDKSKSGFVRVE